MHINAHLLVLVDAKHARKDGGHDERNARDAATQLTGVYGCMLRQIFHDVLHVDATYASPRKRNFF